MGAGLAKTLKSFISRSGLAAARHKCTAVRPFFNIVSSGFSNPPNHLNLPNFLDLLNPPNEFFSKKSIKSL